MVPVMMLLLVVSGGGGWLRKAAQVAQANPLLIRPSPFPLLGQIKTTRGISATFTTFTYFFTSMWHIMWHRRSTSTPFFTC